ncbi:MAG: formylmethanofuran dehydrogenase subunit A [Nitrososphaeria archaeon]|nr:formylmethanofuran dehydrogenase subunit A [Nitrososphaeria archaeon]NIN51609.1 formylmethanofuran dehydrogenase subunit A [Nitrososphaeria archaeon]NIQ32094.1 formylmethanofuran dehydrogenase subunit A [Nitrososphaeria archaeon]
MTQEIIITNGYVYDPINGIEGEKMDILIRKGKIVDKVSPKAEVIDASNMVVMAGGVDLHSHIAGSKVNIGRALRPEDHEKDVEPKTGVTRSGVGYSIPSTFTTGYRYAKMGYTTVFEPATPPMKTRHTHEEFKDIPLLDKACFPLLGNNWFVMEYLQKGMVEECKAYAAWTLLATKGFALKLVNPGGVEAWGFGKNTEHLDEKVPYFEITPREIVRGLCRINQELQLPHAIHVHANKIGTPGNYLTTIETMDCVRDLANGEKPIIHMTHVQFNGLSGNSWINVGSGAPAIAEYVNKNRHVSIDLGQVIFTDTTTMTADGPFQYGLYRLTGNKWINSDVEAETGSGIVPMRYRRTSYASAVQWGVGLELALLIEDPWRVFLTTDHPNGGPFTAYPRVITWLMSKEARKRTLSRINKAARRRLTLPSIDREYSLSEIVVTTRAGTARSLGLKDKGHLGVGADADVAVYGFDPTAVNFSKDYRKVRRAFRKAAYTVKNGRIVVRDGEVVDSLRGRVHWIEARVEEDLMRDVLADLKSKFPDFYTIQMENFFITCPCHGELMDCPAKMVIEAGG